MRSNTGEVEFLAGQGSSQHPARLGSIVIRIVSLLIVLLPIVAGATWIYRSSSFAFQYERQVRTAQNLRSRMIKTILYADSDLRESLITHEPRSYAAYLHADSRVEGTANALDATLAELGLREARSLVRDERATFEEWQTTITRYGLSLQGRDYLMRVGALSDRLTSRIRDDDDRLGASIDVAATAADESQQRLLGQILIGNILLVGSIAVVIGVLLEGRMKAERRSSEQSALYEREKHVASSLQQAFLQQPLPSAEGVRLNSAYVPAAAEREIGGDWYEAFALRDGRLFILIGDVAGHGLEAAVVMNRARQALVNAAVSEDDPATILSRANAAVAAQDARMVTAACAIYDPRSGVLAYATAGHPAPIVAERGRFPVILAAGGPPLGIFEEIALQTDYHAVGEGALIVLHTDGLIEDGQDVIEGQRVLLNAIEKHRDSADPAGDVYREIFGDSRPRDDVAIVALTVLPTAVAAAR